MPGFAGGSCRAALEGTTEKKNIQPKESPRSYRTAASHPSKRCCWGIRWTCQLLLGTRNNSKHDSLSCPVACGWLSATVGQLTLPWLSQRASRLDDTTICCPPIPTGRLSEHLADSAVFLFFRRCVCLPPTPRFRLAWLPITQHHPCSRILLLAEFGRGHAPSFAAHCRHASAAPGSPTKSAMPAAPSSSKTGTGERLTFPRSHA